MPHKDILKELRKYNEDTPVKLTVKFGKKSLVEICRVSGEWRNKWYGCTVETTWRFATLESSESDYTVGDLLKLFRRKSIEKLSSKDLSLQLVEVSDGDTDVYDIEWSEPLTDEEFDEAPQGMDMYNDGEIDCEYEFAAGAIDSIEIYIAGDGINNESVFLTIENNN